jgi:hypothetical protein
MIALAAVPCAETLLKDKALRAGLRFATAGALHTSG